MSEYNYNDSYHFSFEPADEQTRQSMNREPEKPQKKHRGVKIVALALACALVGGAGGAGMTAAAYRSWSQTQPQAVSQTATVKSGIDVTTVSSGVVHVTRNEEGKSLTPADVYASYVQSVVGISCETSQTNIYGQLSTAAVSGTGFVISEDGYIVTNNHVIASANEGTIRVNMADGSSYDAKIVGTEPDNDIALLKIEASGLKTVSIGDSDSLVVGELVCAIGNPLGELTETMTVGYVSALDREINSDGTPINMLQTDCAINPGNSGGALFDMNGNVIGVTTAKYASDELEGLGFAIPINDVMRIVADLMQYGYVTGKAYMGIVPVTIYDNYASYYNLPTGVYVYSVSEGSAAEKAGLKQSDIITKLGDTEVSTYSDLAAAMRDYRAGDTAEITIWRSGEELSFLITFDEKQPTTNTETKQETQEPAEQPLEPSDGYSGFNPFSYFFGFGR